MNNNANCGNLRKIAFLFLLGFLISACNSSTGTFSSGSPGATENASSVAMVAPRIIVSAGIPLDQVDLAVTINGNQVQMQRDDGNQWTGTARIPAGQTFEVNVRWSTTNIDLAVLSKSFAGLASDAQVSFADNEYTLVDSDDDSFTNIAEIVGSSDVNNPASTPVANNPVPVTTDPPADAGDNTDGAPADDAPTNETPTDETPTDGDAGVSNPDNIDTNGDGTLDASDDIDGDGDVDNDDVTEFQAAQNPVDDDDDTTVDSVDPNLAPGNIVPDCSAVDCISANAAWSDNTVLAENRSPVSTYSMGIQRILYCSFPALAASGPIQSYANGIYGAATTLSVLAYQIEKMLVSDGVVGAATWDAFQADLVPMGRSADGEFDLWGITSAVQGCAAVPQFAQSVTEPRGWRLLSIPGAESTVPFTSNFADLP